MIKGFKDFITRGNVIDLAVAVVIGTAFTAVVTAIVTAIINPLISIFYVPDPDGDAGPTLTGIYGQPVTFPLGGLLTAIISFLAIALVVYLVFVYPMNTFTAHRAARAGVPEPEEPKGPTTEELLVQIRDLLEKQAGSSVSTTPPAP